jgi:hypothetical protein
MARVTAGCDWRESWKTGNEKQKSFIGKRMVTSSLFVTLKKMAKGLRATFTG